MELGLEVLDLEDDVPAGASPCVHAIKDRERPAASVGFTRAEQELFAAEDGVDVRQVGEPRERALGSAISSAAARKPAQAVRASVPPTLIRRTPRAAASATVMNGALASRFTGFGATAATTAETCSGRLDPGRVEAVGAGLGVGLQPADRLLEVGPADDEPLGAAGEEDAGAALVDRPPRRPNPLDRELERIEGLVGARRSSPRSRARRCRSRRRASRSRRLPPDRRRSRPRSPRSPGRRRRRRSAEDARAASSRRTPLSERPSVHACPALVVASASKPIRSSATALPTSHGFGITKQPSACSRRKASTFSSCELIPGIIAVPQRDAAPTPDGRRRAKRR